MISCKHAINELAEACTPSNILIVKETQALRPESHPAGMNNGLLGRSPDQGVL